MTDNKIDFKQKKRSLVLNKNVNAIHAYSELGLVEQKIVNALLYNAFPRLREKKKFHEIHVAELAGLIGYKGNDHQRLKESLKNLISKVFEWNVLEDGQAEVWEASAMLASVSIRGPVCTYTYSEHLAEHLANPAIYGRIDMLIQSKFKSSYGLRLYENCIRYQNIPQMRWLEISQVRKLLGVNDKQYQIFRDLKRRVIEAAVKEVNELSPLRLEVEYKKRGRETVAVKFHIEKGQAEQPIFEKMLTEIPKSGEPLSNIAEQLTATFNLSLDDVENICGKYEADYIEEKMRIVEEARKKGGVNCPEALLKTALKQNYLPKGKHDAKDVDDVFEKQQEFQTEQALKKRYFDYLSKEIPQYYNMLTEEEKKEIETSKVFQASLGIMEDLYFKEGLNNPIVRDRVSEYITRQRPELLVKWKVKTLSEFKQHLMEKDINENA